MVAAEAEEGDTKEPACINPVRAAAEARTAALERGARRSLSASERRLGGAFVMRTSRGARSTKAKHGPLSPVVRSRKNSSCVLPGTTGGRSKQFQVQSAFRTAAVSGPGPLDGDQESAAQAPRRERLGWKRKTALPGPPGVSPCS